MIIKRLNSQDIHLPYLKQLRTKHQRKFIKDIFYEHKNVMVMSESLKYSFDEE